jgi:HK97 family phage major capsid protein
MQRLQYAAGGNSKDDLGSGTGAMFLGYPVRFIQSMPKTDAVSQIACYLGDLSMASMYGDRRQITMSFSDSAYVGSRSVFERDETAIRWTNRFDINVHDVGNQSGTAASRVPGPIVGLISAAS